MAKKYQLKNGMQVLLIENKKSPVVSVQMWVKTGSADEKEGEEGISHFIEHLVFKGTNKFAVGEIASTIEGSGGELNAYTSFDQTVFYVTISREFSDTALLSISEMMGFPKFDQAEIDNEREVVIEEIKRGKDSLGRRASQLLFSTAYQKHPYGIPVIGYEENIKSVSRETLLDYFHRRYVPENMLLVIAGDFEEPRMEEKVEEFFGPFKSYPLKQIQREQEQEQKEPRIKIEQSEFEETQIYLGWRAPGVTHEDIPALDVLAMILGQGESSRLVKKLRIDEAIVNSVGSSCYSPKDRGLFLVSMALNDQAIDRSLNIVQEEVQKILAEPPTADELQKAITSLESDEYYGLETVEGMARKAGTLEFLFGDHEYFKKYMNEIYELTPQRLQEVAQKYFVKDQFIATALTKESKEHLEKALKQWIEDFDQKRVSSLATKSAATQSVEVKKMRWNFAQDLTKTPEIQETQLSSGVGVLFRQSEGTPVISLKAVFRGGLREEPQGMGGLSELFARTWVSGTEQSSEQDIIHRVDNMAAGLSGFAGRNSVGLSLDLLKPFEKEGADLFGEVLTSSLWPKTPLEREKVIQKEQLRSRKDSPAQLCILGFMDKLFGNHPYSQSILGDEESIDRIQQQDLLSYWKKISGKKNLLLSISGHFDQDYWTEKLNELTNHLNEGAALEKSYSHEAPTEEQVYFHELKKEQTHIVYGFKGLTFTDEARFDLQVIQSILAGQGGRLFLELRDKASLAYSVAPLRMEGIDTGYFGAYIGCSPEKAKTAIKMMKEQFDRLCDEDISQDEIDRSCRYIIGRHDIDLQRTSAVNSSLLFNKLYGLDPKEAFEVADKFRHITPQSLKQTARRILQQAPVISIVGPNNPV